VFKIAVLREIKQLFMEPDSDESPYYAGFGNKDTDALAYTSVGMKKNRVYIINPKGDIYQPTSKTIWSYPKLNESVDEMFPFVDESQIQHYDYNDAKYWKRGFFDSYELSALDDLNDK
jgi:phosphatidate phosphatase LPIN